MPDWFSIVENDLSSETLVGLKLFESGAFSNSGFGSGGAGRLLEDFGDPKLGELLYSDQPLTQKEVERKGRWLIEAYGPVTEKSAQKS